MKKPLVYHLDFDSREKPEARRANCRIVPGHQRAQAHGYYVRYRAAGEPSTCPLLRCGRGGQVVLAALDRCASALGGNPSCRHLSPVSSMLHQNLNHTIIASACLSHVQSHVLLFACELWRSWTLRVDCLSWVKMIWTATENLGNML